MRMFVIHGRRRQPITVGSLLGRGGEGSVYNLPEMTSAVAKVYDVSKPGLPERIPQRRLKIEAMLAHPPHTLTVDVQGTKLPLLAWPTHVVETEDPVSCGFLMPKVSPENSLSLARYMQDIPSGKVLTREERCLTSRLFLCRSLSGVLTDLHRQGHYVVDFKPENLRVFRNSCIPCFLDNDSFSIAGKDGLRLPSTVFTPEYAAPELLGGKSAAPGSVVNDLQDRFALAVLLFQILNRGFHPFQGILKQTVANDETMLEHKIRLGLYPYGLVPDPRVNPCEGSDHDCLPQATRQLFDRAFQRAPEGRPSAKDWRDHFENYLRIAPPFTACAKNPTCAMHIHFAGQPCGECRRQPLVVRPTPPFDVTHILTGIPATPSWKERIPWRLIGFLLLLMAAGVFGYFNSPH
jgi:eukaryotic-like serine/threonine-protein kinase